MKTFDLPDLGEGLPEAEIVTWHVKVGDTVSVDQPMLSVETAKAVVEVPAPYSGTVAKLYAGDGDIVETGKPLIDIHERSSIRNVELNFIDCEGAAALAPVIAAMPSLHFADTVAIRSASSCRPRNDAFISFASFNSCNAPR